MHNELSIEKGTLENASETLRFIQNVRTQIGLRALTADFVVGKWQGWFNVWLDLKNDPSETAQKLLNTVLNNGAGHPLNDPQLFGKEISELAERIGDILMDAHGYTRAEILSRYAHSDAPPICVYIYDFTRSVLGYIYGHSSETLREAIVGKYRIPNPNDVFVYYEPALTIFLDDRAQYEALLARKDEVVRDVYTLTTSSAQDSEAKEKPPCIRSVIVPIAGKNWIFPSGTSARTAGSATGFYTAIGRRCCFC